MSGSNPTTGVPTPTGTLQGAAAFNWDGVTWQPSALKPAASVATPTGVLRGVAPFAWDGTAWQPVGQAAASVATPTGVLDGVALYTWSGSAWTPAGGAPDVPTPSGVLQGVAGFYFDGTVWQPAGQAAPEVATPSGVLTGMAMFNWNGTAWAPAVSPASLDLNFVTMSTLDPRITFTRASIGTYFDGNGVMQTAGNNVARLDHNPVTHAAFGLLIEEQRTNNWLQSADLSNAATAKSQGGGAPLPTLTGNQMAAPDGTVTAAMVVLAAGTSGQWSTCAQSFTATVNPYSFSIWMKGSVGGETLYIAATPDAVTYYRTLCTLTTAWQRFVLSTPNLTAVTWYFELGFDRRDAGQTNTPAQTIFAWGAQVEQGAFPTSYIPTSGSAVTRSADVATIASASIPSRNAAAETFAADYLLQTAQNSNSRILAQATGTNLSVLFVSPSTTAGTYDGIAIVYTANGVALGNVAKAAVAWNTPNNTKLCLNAGAVATATTMTAGFGSIATFKLMGDANTPEQSNGWIRRVRYWPRALSNAELQSVTT